MNYFSPQMGCGPSMCCPKCNGLGEVSNSSDSSIYNMGDIKKFMIYTALGTIVGSIVSELIVARWLFPKSAQANPKGKIPHLWAKAKRMYTKAKRGGSKIDDKWAFINAKYQELLFNYEMD